MLRKTANNKQKPDVNQKNTIKKVLKVISKSWDKILKEEYKKEYFKKLTMFFNHEYTNKIIYPEKINIFKSLKLTPYENIKIVILGQDPYHEENQAEGLAFSVKEGIRKPPSLKNIFKEMKEDININEPESGSLISWSREGVLLLNTILTVESKKPLSHKNKGWETFTNEIISQINNKETPIIFILWGKEAQKKKGLITNTKHLILESSHPSPFSAYKTFFGSKPFSRSNTFLIKNKINPVNFKLD
jgi:uracil-DNA glycosylase